MTTTETQPLSAPRTRGDGPVAAGAAARVERCSPHPRGWSLALLLGNVDGFL
ncbi:MULTISPECIES: hypothetical protein [Streptomyces]|uniref:hypothetical protein n=1 Tax=Streptomyces TaxID=1883 RepID=UPI001B363CEB|nr:MULTISPECIES: hypothetical protein [Streptomyces]MBQ0914734.1 hypothetical protein [Streptomyces sp. RM99]MBX4173530.1 hypothetical protein [Streptomyces geysiriensis]